MLPVFKNCSVVLFWAAGFLPCHGHTELQSGQRWSDAQVPDTGTKPWPATHDCCCEGVWGMYHFGMVVMLWFNQRRVRIASQIHFRKRFGQPVCLRFFRGQGTKIPRAGGGCMPRAFTSCSEAFLFIFWTTFTNSQGTLEPKLISLDCSISGYTRWWGADVCSWKHGILACAVSYALCVLAAANYHHNHVWIARTSRIPDLNCGVGGGCSGRRFTVLACLLGKSFSSGDWPFKLRLRTLIPTLHYDGLEYMMWFQTRRSLYTTAHFGFYLGRPST